MERNLQNAINIAFSSPSNVSEDICLLKTLKIVPRDLRNLNTRSLYDYESNTAYIDYDELKKHLKDTEERTTLLTLFNPDTTYRTFSEDEYFTKIYAYIINQVRERVCECRKEKGETNTSVSYNFSLANVLAVEKEEQILSSIEFSDISPRDKFPHEFLFNSDYEASLLLLATFYQGRTIDDLQRTIFDTDLNGLHTFFGLETDEDLETFYRINEQST